MSHISVYSLANLLIDKSNENDRKNREIAEKMILKELERNFINLTERQEDSMGNLKLLLKVNQKAVPGKTGEVEILINKDNTLTIDVSKAPGKACKELTQPLEMILGPPISVKYKQEYYDTKVPLNDRKKSSI